MFKKGYKQTEEHKRKISEANKGKKLLKETKKKISDAKKGKKRKPFTDETKLKLSISAKERIIKKPYTIPSHKGKCHTEEAKLKISNSHKGKKLNEKNPEWKGDDVGYYGLHAWVKRHKGNPIKCEHCGKIGKKINGKWNLQWSNKDHKYRRVLKDYIGLCISCHIKYDNKKK